MKKWPVAALFLSCVPVGFCADATIAGQGHVFSSPDYVEVLIQISSVCYPTPEQARKINDESARKIVDFLNKKIQKKDPYNTVIATGGYTSPYQTYYQDRVLCQNTFQKQSQIIFRTQKIENFETLFDEIQNTVYKEVSASPGTVIQSSISYASIGIPSPGISNKRQSELEQQAISLAFEDAMAKLKVLFGSNTLQNLKITSASELPPQGPKPVFREDRSMAMLGARMEQKAEPAPVQFGEERIDKTIYFKFVFDDILLPQVKTQP